MSDRDGWVSDDDLSEATTLARSVYGENASSTSGISAAFAKAQATKIFEENAATAAQTLVRLAKSGQNENVRLRAAESILNRALGTPISADKNGNDKNKLDELFEALGENDGTSPDTSHPPHPDYSTANGPYDDSND
jgi:type IV secretory pathway VirB4 component